MFTALRLARFLRTPTLLLLIATVVFVPPLVRAAARLTDPSTASRTQLGAPAWDPALLEAFGVPAGVLPALAPTAALGDVLAGRHPLYGRIRATGSAPSAKAIIWLHSRQAPA